MCHHQTSDLVWTGVIIEVDYMYYMTGVIIKEDYM